MERSCTRLVRRTGAPLRPGALALMIAALLSACGAPRRDEGAMREAGVPILVETHNLLSSKPGMTRLDISIGVPLGFFVFVRANTENAAAPFVARTDVAVEIRDKSRTTVSRNIFRREIPSPDQTPNPQGEKFLQEMYSCDLPPGDYTVVTEVSDRESSRRFIDRGRPVSVKDFSSGPLEISDALFLADSAANDSAPVPAASLGGDLPFGKRAYGYVEFTSEAEPESLRASFAIRPLHSGEGVDTGFARASFSEVRVSRTRFIVPVRGEDGYSYRLNAGPRPGRFSVWIPAISDTLTQGTYEMETRITGGGSSAAVRHTFRIRWIDMPRSLRNIRQAVEALKYIADDSVETVLRSAPRDKQQALLDDFWKRRDPTPGTAFNERELEFYTRVDYATDNFGTLHEPNGMRTDRGRAYILYGPPGSVERTLHPSGDPEEIWKYPTLHVRLRFVDKEHHGDYRLVETGTI